jgi:hypothetical protein
MRRSYYTGVDTMQLLDTNENSESEKIWDTLNETKSELSNTNNIIKYIEQQTSDNIKLISTDLHHISENFLKLKHEHSELKDRLEEVLQINRILANKVTKPEKKENNDLLS